jgi:hypothetical protein
LRKFGDVTRQREITYNGSYENISVAVKHLRTQLEVFHQDSGDPFKWPHVNLPTGHSEVLSRIVHDVACEADEAGMFTLRIPRKRRKTQLASKSKKKPLDSSSSFGPAVKKQGTYPSSTLF